MYVGEHELQKKRMQDQMTLAMLLKDRLLLETELAQYERLVQKRKLMDEQWLSLGNTVLQWWGGAALPDTEQRLTKIIVKCGMGKCSIHTVKSLFFKCWYNAGC